AVFKQQVSLYHHRVRQRVREGLRISSLFRQHGVMIRENAFVAAEDRPALQARLPALKDLQEMVPLLWSSYDAAVEHEEQWRRRLVRLGKQEEVIQRFTALPGISWIRGATLYAYLDTPWRFRSKAALWKYLGIGLERKHSGNGPEYLGVPTRAHRLLKGTILGAACSAVASGDNPFAELYGRWIEQGTTRISCRAGSLSAYRGRQNWRLGQLHPFDTDHGLAWDGPGPVPRVYGLEAAKLRPKRGIFRKGVAFQPQCGLRRPDPSKGDHDAFLQPAAPILLWRRFARQNDVPVHPRPGRRHRLAPGSACRARRLPRSRRALPRRARRRLRVSVLLVLAGRPVCRREDRFCLGPRSVHEGHPRRQIRGRPHRFPKDRSTRTRRQPAHRLRLSQGAARNPRPVAPPHVPGPQTRRGRRPRGQHQQSIQPAAVRQKTHLRPEPASAQDRRTFR